MKEDKADTVRIEREKQEQREKAKSLPPCEPLVTPGGVLGTGQKQSAADDYIDEVLVMLFFSNNAAWVVATNLRMRVRELEQELRVTVQSLGNQQGSTKGAQGVQS